MDCQPRRTHGILLALVLGLALPPSPVRCQPSPPVAMGGLGPDVARSAELPAGRAHRWTIQIDTPGFWRIAVEQSGVDLRIEVLGPGGDVVKTVDNPLIRHGPETLVLTPEQIGDFQVLLLPSEELPLDGRYSIQLSRLAAAIDDDATVRAMLERELASSQAAEVCATGGAEQRLEAMELYRRAAKPSDLATDRRTRATALMSLGLLAQEIGRGDEALESFRQVFPIWKGLGDTLLAADALNESGLIYLDKGSHEKARDFLGRSAELHSSVGNPHGEAVVRGNLCFIDLSTGEARSALPCFERVLALHETTGDLAGQATTLLNLGGALGTLGEPTEAIERFDRAREISRHLGNALGEAQALANLAWVHEGVGEIQPALEYYLRALEVVRAAGDRRWEARVLNNLGSTYWRLGDLPRARSLLEEAIPIRREVEDSRGEAITWTVLGHLFLHQGRNTESLVAHGRALDLARDRGDRLREGRSLGYLGEVHLAMGALEPAARLLAEALDILIEVEDPRGEGRVRLARGRLHLRRDALDDAGSELDQALELLRRSKHRILETSALVELAHLERRHGRLGRAVERAEEAIGLVEALRAPVASPTQRASLVANLRSAYELMIDLRIEQYETSGDPGFYHLAFHAGERARARSLIDLLMESQTTDRRDLPSDLAQPELATLAQVRGLLDPGTLWLQYALGGRRSFLWVIDDAGATVHILPARDEIEPAVRRLHRLLGSYGSQPNPGGLESEAHALGRQLLAPAADRMRDAKRLVVVPDGVLHYLPFAALPLPRATGEQASGESEPLLARYELVSLPSASVLALQRQRHAARSPAPRTLLTVGDPVFGRSDPRFQPDAAGQLRNGEDALAPTLPTSEPVAVLRQAELDGFDRLPSTRREAESVAALYPPDQRTLLLGFEASRERFVAAAREHRILHVATHGLLDTQQAERSALVLSRLDRSGRPVDGLLRLQDLHTLDLRAELVVASGCRTALGREIRGEGLVGLTRGFMDAGAERVMASLWNVQDRATAELMIAFHRRLSEGQTAAAALRAAQLDIRQQRRWQAPYFWAAFVLQGDWR